MCKVRCVVLCRNLGTKQKKRSVLAIGSERGTVQHLCIKLWDTTVCRRLVIADAPGQAATGCLHAVVRQLPGAQQANTNSFLRRLWIWQGVAFSSSRGKPGSGWISTSSNRTPSLTHLPTGSTTSSLLPIPKKVRAAYAPIKEHGSWADSGPST